MSNLQKDKEKTRILFCIENVRQGGISKALDSLLPMLDKDTYNTKVFCINPQDGPYKNTFQEYYIDRPNWVLYALSTYYTEHKGIKKYLFLSIKTVNKILKKLFKTDLFQITLSKESKKISSMNFDAVIAFSEGIVTRFCTNIKTPKKIAWIHLDYKRYMVYTNNVDESDIFSHYDNIIIPSEHCSKSFIEILPQFKNKVRVIPNLVDYGKIMTLALHDEELDKRFINDSFTIVSVGRICSEKRFYEIPRIASGLKRREARFKWYIIGDGSKMETGFLSQMIDKYNVQDEVIMLGGKDNPYPYIKHSSLVAVTSLTETFCYVIAEAKTLQTPVVSTNFGTAYEVLEPSHGIICDLQDFESEIYRLISNNNEYLKLKRNLKGIKYSNNTDLFTELIK